MSTNPSSVPWPSGPGATTVCVIIVGGGSGQRFGSLKQFEQMLGTDGRVIDRSIEVAVSAADRVVVVVPPDHVDAEAERAATAYPGAVTVVAGGATRSASVRSGLAAAPDDCAVICVHDAARPLASATLYQRVIDATLADADGVVPAMPVTDTIKVVDDAGWVVDTPSRDHLAAVQTPQGFRADMLRRAHQAAPDGSDDAVLVEAIGGKVRVIEGERANIKITHPDDLAVVGRAVSEDADASVPPAAPPTGVTGR